MAWNARGHIFANSHKEAISQEFSKHADRIFLLSQSAGFSPFDILDPFGGDNTTVEMVSSEIIDIIDQGFDLIVKLLINMEFLRKEGKLPGF